MEPDKYQQAWQAQKSQTRVTIDADLLLKDVQRHQRNFRNEVIWGDVGELAIVCLLLPIWIYLGVKTSSPWSWYLTIPVLIWYVLFRLMYRKRHKQKPSEPDEPLLQCVKNSLIQIEDQIWLFRNVFWWSLLPLSISFLAFLIHVFLPAANHWWEFLIALFFSVLAFGVPYGAIYFGTQRTVRSKYEPRRQELLTLLASLEDETTGEVVDDQVNLPGLPFADASLQLPCPSPAIVAAGVIGIAVILLFLVMMVSAMNDRDPDQLTGVGYPKMSPFAAVRWRESEPEVNVNDQWYKLISLDDLPAAEIVAYCQQTYGNIWRKRFEEDIVEVLTRMGHPPKNNVSLVVQSLTSSQTQTLKDIPMTKENRKAIRNAARSREAL